MSTNAVNMSTTSLPMCSATAATGRVEKATAAREPPPKTRVSFECREANDVAAGFANVEFYGAIECLVTRLYTWRVRDASLDRIEVGDARNGNEECRAVSRQFCRLTRAVVDHTGPGLVHD